MWTPESENCLIPRRHVGQEKQGWSSEPPWVLWPSEMVSRNLTSFPGLSPKFAQKFTEASSILILKAVRNMIFLYRCFYDMETSSSWGSCFGLVYSLCSSFSPFRISSCLISWKCEDGIKGFDSPQRTLDSVSCSVMPSSLQPHGL